MKQRFSKEELFRIRNGIPIDQLIERVLCLPCKNADGIFRFLCPVCAEFQTATKASTNLARCFRCQRNFNTIDLVMIVKGVDFQKSVEFIRPLLQLGTQAERKPLPAYPAVPKRRTTATGSLQSVAAVLRAAGFSSSSEKQ